MKYDNTLRSFQIFTQDPAFEGSHEYEVSAYLTDYPVTKTADGEATGLIVINTPCHDALLTYAPTNWPTTYQYIATFVADTQTILDSDVQSTVL